MDDLDEYMKKIEEIDERLLKEDIVQQCKLWGIKN